MPIATLDFELTEDCALVYKRRLHGRYIDR